MVQTYLDTGDNVFKVFIPSKDRPQQLRLLLKSMELYLSPEFMADIFVCYAYSNDEFKAGYDKLFAEKKWKIRLAHESSPKSTIDYICSLDPELNLLLLTDDSVFYQPCKLSLEDLKYFNDNYLTFSLRFGENTTIIDYLNPQSREKWAYTTDKGLMDWSWKEHKSGHVSYPIGLDGSIIKIKNLKKLTREVERNNYRQWEGNISALAKRFEVPIRTLAYKRSCVVNNPVNQVVDAGVLKNGIKFNYPLKTLNDLYINDGIIIDVRRTLPRSDTVNSVQMEFPFFFRKQMWYDNLLRYL